MKEIELTQGLKAQVDDEDYEKLNMHKWCADKHRNTYYAQRQLPAINGKRTKIKMHHVIIGKPPKGLETDHRDGNGLHNFKTNLRFVTNRQNHQNRKHVKASSKYPGVSWFERDQNWRARISINRRGKHLGYFKTEIEAFNAYQKAVEAIGETVLI